MKIIEEIKEHKENFNGEVRILKEPEKLDIKLFNSNDVFIGIVDTEYQLMDVLCQIKENKLEGYSIEMDGEIFTINKSGRIPDARCREKLMIYDNFLNRLLGF